MADTEDMPTDFSETTERGATTADSGEREAKRIKVGEDGDDAAVACSEKEKRSPPPPPPTPYRLPPGLPDPLSSPHCDPSPVVRDGDHVLLHFGDGRRLFAQCCSSSWKGGGGGKRPPPTKINKRSYPTANLIGLPYGTVLEVGKNSLVPLPDGEDVMPDASKFLDGGGSGRSSPVPPAAAATSTTDEGDSASAPASTSADNRHLVDTNTSQTLRQRDIEALRDGGAHGSDIVARLVGASSTFDGKTEFSQRKYIARKQMKHQPRCRVVRCTPYSLCDAWFRKDPRRILHLREDSLAQILSHSNVCAGSKVLVFEQTQGIITGALAQRMGGYGKVMSLFTATQTSYGDMMSRYNLTFAEAHSVKWVHAGEVFGEGAERPVMPAATSEAVAPAAPPPTANGNAPSQEEKEGEAAVAEAEVEKDVEKDGCDNADEGGEEKVVDYELADRLLLEWPCPLQDHTRRYLGTMPSDRDRSEFLSKRCARFARKLTRHTTLEARAWLYGPGDDGPGDDDGDAAASDGRRRPFDSLVVATRYDPTETLLEMMPFLAPSCPFVVFSEFVEPLAECFRELQRKGSAINLRLSDTWMREYQVLPGRTHPSMSMSQSGGFILTGLKLCDAPPRREEKEGDSKEPSSEKGGRGQRRRQHDARDKPGENDAKKKPRR